MRRSGELDEAEAPSRSPRRRVRSRLTMFGSCTAAVAAGRRSKPGHRGRETGGIARPQFTERDASKPRIALLVARLYEQQADSDSRATNRENERLRRAEQQLTSVAQQSDAVPCASGGFDSVSSCGTSDGTRQRPGLIRLETQVQAMPKDDAGVSGPVIQLQLQHGSPRRAEKWIAKLEKIDPTPVRALGLEGSSGIRPR